MRWALQIGDPHRRDAILMRVAIGFAEDAPAAAIRLARRRIAEHGLRAQAVAGALGLWARNDAPAAASVVEELKDAESRRLGFLAVADMWAQKDPQAAIAWAHRIQEDKTRDFALAAGALGLARRNPQEAADLARRIRDSTARDSAFEGIYELARTCLA